MPQELLFIVGNAVAIAGGLMALVWAATSRRFYWRRRSRGMTALALIVAGVVLMAYGKADGSTTSPASPSSTTKTTAHALGAAPAVG